MSNTDNCPLVSYIITVLNGEKYIGRTLKGVKSQTYPNIEIIVVDNFSTDKTREIVRSFSEVKLFLKGPERSSQLRYGLEQARGKYVFTTGCDLVADNNYIEKCVNICESSDYVAVYAGVISETTNFWSKVKAIERLCYIGDDIHEAARFLRKDVLEKIGGFDSDLVLHGDDYEVQARLNKFGYKTGRVDAVEVHIDEIDSIKEVFLKSFYYGMNSWKYIKKHPGHATKQLMPIRKSFFKNYKLFLKHPLLASGLVVFKIVQYGSASVGLLFAILRLNKISSFFHNLIYKKNR